MYLGVGGQKKLVEFLSSKMANDEFLESEAWKKFLAMIGMDKEFCQKEGANLFFSGMRQECCNLLLFCNLFFNL